MLTLNMCKDWPSTTDFKQDKDFRVILADFPNAIPATDIMALDGCQNVATYFPEGIAKPDLGMREITFR